MIHNKRRLIHLVFSRTIYTILIVSIFSLLTTTTFADRSPAGCTGSGLEIDLFTSLPTVHIGDTISFSVNVFNGIGSGPVVCDASNIEASIVTPDGAFHPVSLTRTALTSGQSDTYTNVVTYVARAQDVQAGGILTASASDTGDIHQNDTDSQGGGHQGVNIQVVAVANPTATLHIVKSVVNTHGGTAIPSSFMLHVKHIGVDVTGSPAAGAVSPGTLYTLATGAYVVSEDVNALYTQSFSGDCNSSGTVLLFASMDKTCTITNSDIATLVVVTPTSTPTTTPVVTPPVVVVPPPVYNGGGGVYAPIPPTTPVSTSTVSVPTPIVTNIAAASVVVPYFPNTGFSPKKNIEKSIFIYDPLVFILPLATAAPLHNFMHLFIPTIGVDAVIEPVGVTSSGALDTPKGPTTTGWFDQSPRPGEKGVAIIDGHYGWKNNIPTVFNNLHTVKKGDHIYVADQALGTSTFVVTAIKSYGEHDNDSDVFVNKDGESHLNIITCGGVWNKAQHRYSKRLVVFTDLVKN